MLVFKCLYAYVCMYVCTKLPCLIQILGSFSTNFCALACILWVYVHYINVLELRCFFANLPLVLMYGWPFFCAIPTCGVLPYKMLFKNLNIHLWLSRMQFCNLTSMLQRPCYSQVCLYYCLFSCVEPLVCCIACITLPYQHRVHNPRAAADRSLM